MEGFVKAYLDCGCATEAAGRSGITFQMVCPDEGAYVYLLLCPELQSIIYVGKGRGRRMLHHVRDAKAGRISGTKKHKAIVAFIEAGLEPVAVVIASGLEDDKALELEKQVMLRIGRDRLSNTAPGQGSGWLRALAQLDDLERRIMPYDQWVERRKPKAEHLHMHATVRQQIAETRAWIEAHV